MKKTIKQFHLIKFFGILFFVFTVTSTSAIELPKKTVNEKEVTTKKADSIAKTEESIKVKEVEQVNKTAENVRPLPAISESTIKTISILFFVVMLVLIVLFFIQAYLKNMYLGFQSIKFIGLVIMFPGICIVALMGGDLLPGSTLAALLGTIAGYVLSREDDSTKDALKREKKVLEDEKDALNKEVELLKTKIKELQTKKE